MVLSARNNQQKRCKQHTDLYIDLTEDAINREGKFAANCDDQTMSGMAAVMLTRTWDPRPRPRPRTQVTRSRPRPWGIKAKAKDFGPKAKAKAKDLGLKAKAKDLRCQSQ